MSRTRTSVAAAMAALLVSCSLVLGIEDRRVGDADAATDLLFEGGTGAVRTNGPDASRDGTAPASGAACGQPHKACLDFEDGKLTTPTLEHAALSIDGPGSSSAGALHAVAESEQTARAYVRLPFSGNLRGFSWAFDVLLDQRGTNLELNEIVLPGSNGECKLQPAVREARLAVYENCPAVTQVVHDLGPLKVGAGWYHLSLAVDFGGIFGPKKLTVLVQRPGEDSTSSEFTLGGTFGMNMKAELHAGLTHTDPATPGANLRVDNVTLDYE